MVSLPGLRACWTWCGLGFLVMVRSICQRIALLQLGLSGVLMIRAGVPRLPTNHGPPQRFRAALLDQVSADLSGRKGFSGLVLR